MSEPLSREERALMDEWSATGALPDGSERILQSLRETEQERDIARSDRLSAHRNALAAITRAEAAEERAERYARWLADCLPALRRESHDADLDGDQVLASVTHRVHEEIVAALAADDARGAR